MPKKSVVYKATVTNKGKTRSCIGSAGSELKKTLLPAQN